jgi:hypothetical protein
MTSEAVDVTTPVVGAAGSLTVDVGDGGGGGGGEGGNVSGSVDVNEMILSRPTVILPRRSPSIKRSSQVAADIAGNVLIPSSTASDVDIEEPVVQGSPGFRNRAKNINCSTISCSSMIDHSWFSFLFKKKQEQQ